MQYKLRGDLVVKELHYTKLKNFISVQDINFETTEKIEATSKIIGQERAAKALELGLNIKSKGYNIYIAGLPGTGKTTFAEKFAKKIASTEQTPPDLCYIYNFDNPKFPKTLTLPTGCGKIFREEMEELISRLEEDLPKVFNNKEFENRKMEIIKNYQNKRDVLIKDMTDEAREQNFGVKTTNSGIYFMPIIDGEVISEEQYDSLKEEDRDDISKNSEVIQKKAADVMRSMKEFEKSTRKEVEDLEYSEALFTIGKLISPILEKYESNETIIKYLLDLKEDILENLDIFIEEESEEEESIQAILPWYSKKSPEETFTKYKVNLLTDNSTLNGAPVVVDFNPTYSNLVGEIEYENEFGNLTTDFMKIKPGLLHKANGGYLILQAHDVLSNAHAWDVLRRVLLTGEIVTEPLREYTTGYAVYGIKPEPVKLDLKIILVGTGFYYELLHEYDDEFQKLFKICADFDYEMNFNIENLHNYVGFIKRFIDKEKLSEFDYSAVIRVMEYSSRISENQEKLTARFNKISEILIESATWARLKNCSVVSLNHVNKAIEEKEMRCKLYEDKLTEMLENNIIMIDTHGEKVGQINGLAVLETCEYAFAKPSKITATTYVGKSGIINIEKEAEMSGSIHDKGVLVLSGYLGQSYAQNFPLSLSCRICFEQTYSGVDGDSASSTELYAILSSLSEIPINQGIAVTGSINQIGEIQPVGGVTYKIEGFFDLCKKRGLTGKQGVIIPAQNVPDLVLKDDVINSVKEGMFHIYAITHIDEGIEILMGIPAGEKDERGKFPPETVHGMVYKKLKSFYKKSMLE